MTLLLKHLAASLREPEFWGYSSWLDIVTKYRRSRLGLVWLLLPPAMYVAGIGYFFARLQGADPLKFIPHLGLGYLIYRLASNVITESCSVLVGHASFILDGHLRLTDFVLRTMAKALFYLVAALPIIVTVLWIAPNLQPAGLLTALPALLWVLLNLVWVSVAMSLLGARFPDVIELTGSIFIFAFILTPILWYAEAAPPGTLHGTFMRINPLFHMVEVVRAPLLGEPLESLTLWYLSAMTVLGWSTAIWLYRRYSRFVPIWV
jgi:ABC-2 type transport system permease protein